MCQPVSFAEVVLNGPKVLEGVGARYVSTVDDARFVAESGSVAVLVDAQAQSVAALRPVAVVDAIMAKRNTGTHRAEAPLVIGLGPGFLAGEDVHVVVETKRGHNMGRVIRSGSAELEMACRSSSMARASTASLSPRQPVRSFASVLSASASRRAMLSPV